MTWEWVTITISGITSFTILGGMFMSFRFEKWEAKFDENRRVR